MSMALVMSEMPDVYRRVLAEHVPDAGGRCGACRNVSGETASWPCQTYRIAQEAKWVSEGNLPGTGPHGSVNPLGESTPDPSVRARLLAGHAAHRRRPRLRVLRSPGGRPAAAAPGGGPAASSRGRRLGSVRHADGRAVRLVVRGRRPPPSRRAVGAPRACEARARSAPSPANAASRPRPPPAGRLAITVAMVEVPSVIEGPAELIERSRERAARIGAAAGDVSVTPS